MIKVLLLRILLVGNVFKSNENIDLIQYMHRRTFKFTVICLQLCFLKGDSRVKFRPLHIMIVVTVSLDVQWDMNEPY